MELRQYFRKLREIEVKLADDYPVLVSLETGDGGKAGVVSEVSRETAAKLILENKAVEATAEQKAAFLKLLEARKKSAEARELARRVQVAIIADPELQNSVVNKVPALQGNTK